MTSQITDQDIQTFASAIDAAWAYCNELVASGITSDNSQRLGDVTTKAQEAGNLLLTACEQRNIYETLDAQIKADAANGNYDPFLPETMKRNAVYMVEYTTNRMAKILFELQQLTK